MCGGIHFPRISHACSLGPVALGLFLTSAAVGASPILSVDTDPSIPGVQPALTVGPGDSFSVDVVISGVDAAEPLNAFQFSLDYLPSILGATGVVDGGFLPSDPVSGADLGPPVVAFAAALGPTGAVGDGLLATVSFEAGLTGTSTLDLLDVVLSAPFGVPIEVAGTNDAIVMVSAPEAIPEPRTAMLCLAGLLLTGLARRCARSMSDGTGEP